MCFLYNNKRDTANAMSLMFRFHSPGFVYRQDGAIELSFIVIALDIYSVK